MGGTPMNKHRLNPSINPAEDLWVFAYGSLMWDPGFTFETSETALLHGYHRAFRLFSYRYRGSAQAPGLVLGLDLGGACRGIAYRVAGKDTPAAMDYLLQREMTGDVYHCRRLAVRIGKHMVRALGFVINRGHAHYTGRLSDGDTAKFIRQGCGERGSSLAYFENTLRHLDELGIRDDNLHRLRSLIDPVEGLKD